MKRHAPFRETSGYGNRFSVRQRPAQEFPCFRFLGQGNETEQLAAVRIETAFQKAAAKALFPADFFCLGHCFAAAAHFLPERLFRRSLVNHRGSTHGSAPAPPCPA